MTFAKEIGQVNGAGKFKSIVSKITREMKKKNPKSFSKAMVFFTYEEVG